MQFVCLIKFFYYPSHPSKACKMDSWVPSCSFSIDGWDHLYNVLKTAAFMVGSSSSQKTSHCNSFFFFFVCHQSMSLLALLLHLSMKT